MSSSSSNNQFIIDVKIDNKSNNIVITIKELFLNVKNRLSYERFMEKIVYGTCEFFMHSAKHMNFKNLVALCGIKLGLNQFQALEIFLMLQIKVDIYSGNIFVDKIENKNVKYLIFQKFIANIIKCLNF